VSDATIEVTGVRKRFGPTPALNGMTFTVTPGRVTGFVGPNGAGKSTTIRVILGLDAPDEGHALVCGQAYQQLRQRLGIAAALLGDPPVIIMDEPFNGMDPEGIIWMRQLLRSFAGEGRAILISSHLMGELQDIANHLVVVGRGKVLADASVDELVAHASGDRVVVRTPAPTDSARVLEGSGARTEILDSFTVSVSGLAAHHIVQALSQAGVPFSEVIVQRARLEDVYLQLTSGEVEFRGGSDSGSDGQAKQ
jgi:ABC-2 type transport system ATP-binding protein